jgi:hypothetical protein
MTQRIAQDMVQCPLDKKTYNYAEGYTTEKGEKVPGGSVSEQTPKEAPQSPTMFSTRVDRLQNFER